MAARTNLMTNPSFEVDLTGVTTDYGTSGAGALTRPTSGGYAGSCYSRMTWTTGSTAVSGGMILSALAALPAAAVAASVRVKVNSAQRLRLALGGGAGSSSGVATPVDVPANTWTTLTLTATANGGSGYSLLVLPTTGGFGRNWASGDTLDVDAVQLDTGSGEFFDGSTVKTGFRYVWNGTQNASTSTETLPTDIRHTYTATSGAVANPTIAVTDTPAAGDVLVLMVATGGVSSGISAVTGCGATWSRVPAAVSTSGVLDIWIGAGATTSGTVTTTGSAVARSLYVAMASGVTPTAVGVTASGTGLQSSPAQTAGQGQIVFGMSYSTDAASTVTATTPSTGWAETDLMLAASAYSGNVYRVPTATESHTFSVQRPTGTGYISQLVLGGPRTNLFTDPSAEGAGLTWTTVLGANSVAQSTAIARTGAASYAMTTASSATQEFITPTGTSGFPVVAGNTYTLSFYSRAATTLRTVTAKLAFYSAAGASLGVLAGGGASNSTSAFTRHSAVAVVAPATAAFASVQIRVSSGLSGEVHYFDDFLLEESGIVGSYFSGASTQTDFTYGWTGTPNASTSTETNSTGSAPIASDFAGSGALTTVWSNYVNLSSGFSGAGVLGTVWRDYRNLYSGFAGSGTLTTAVIKSTIIIASSFSGSGALATALSNYKEISSTFAGDGVLDTVRSGYVNISTTFSGDGTLTTANTAPTVPADITSTFSGNGALQAVFGYSVRFTTDYSSEGFLFTELGYVVLPAELGTDPLGKRVNYNVTTSAVPLNPTEGSGSTPSVSATYLKGIDPELALGERNVLTAGNIGTYEGEIVNLSVDRASTNVTTSMSTALTLLNNELSLFPFIDEVSSKWAAARAIDYWTQQTGLFYDKVPGTCIAYASAYGHSTAYGASTVNHFYEKLTGGSTVTTVVNERSVRTFGDDTVGTTAFHEDAKASVAFTLLKNQKLVFSAGIGIRGTGRTSTVSWNFVDPKDRPHSLTISATSGGYITTTVDGVLITTATVAGNENYRIAASLEQLGSSMVGKLTVHEDDLAGNGSVVYADSGVIVAYNLPKSLRLKSITHSTSGGSGSEMLRWGTYLTIDSNHPKGVPAIQKELLESTKTRRFVSGFQGNVWNMLNEFCSIARLDVRFVGEKLFVGPRISTLTAPDGNFSQFTYNSERRDKYKQVAVRNLQSKVVTDNTAVLWRSDSVYQIAAREVFETTVQTDHSILNLVQPVAVNAISPFPYKRGGGQYVVTGADGYIISPAWWYDNGGKVEVSLTEKEGEIAIKITAPDLDTVRAPYRLSEGEADRPALYISGSGILNTPKEVHVGTGAKNAKEGFDNVFESPFVAGVVETYDVAMAMASEYSTMNADVEFEIPNDFDTPSRFGEFPAGTIFTDNVRNYRIQNATQTHSKVSGTAVTHTTIGAFVESMPEGATIADLKARFFGATIRQFNIKPLRGTSV